MPQHCGETRKTKGGDDASFNDSGFKDKQAVNLTAR